MKVKRKYNPNDRVFYIYRHIRLDKNTPFYIGKGSGERAYQKKSRNNYWKSIAKLGYRVDIIIKNLNQEEAFKKEIELIKFYKSFNFCEANFTNGGEGGCGVIKTEANIKYVSLIFKGTNNPMYGKPRSEEAKRKTSEKVKGVNNPIYGKPRSEEVRLKISKTHKERGHGCKPVKCIETGVVYQSAKHAEDALNLHATSIIMVCRGKAKHTGKLSFIYFKGN